MAALSGRTGLDLPQRKRSYRFALTPLADAMFQLLIFFMLSSSLTPYSLITLQSGADPGQGATDGTGTEAPDAEALPGETALWSVEADGIVVGGQSFGFERLPALAEALVAADPAARVILILRPSARVQDVARVLETLDLAEIGSVQIAAGPS